MEIYIIENVRGVRNPRRKKNLRMSVYRETKTSVHTTVNGIGRVGKLVKNK